MPHSVEQLCTGWVNTEQQWRQMTVIQYQTNHCVSWWIFWSQRSFNIFLSHLACIHTLMFLLCRLVSFDFVWFACLLLVLAINNASLCTF